MNKKFIKIVKYFFLTLIILILIIIGIFAFWKIKANFVYQKAVRNADISQIYNQTTNGISNKELILAARNYIKQKPQVSNTSFRLEKLNWEEVLGDSAVNWLLSHAPENVYYTDNITIGMEEYHKNRYTVSWTYFSNCEKIERWGEEVWINRNGIMCAGGTVIIVVLNSDLSPYMIDMGLLW